MKVFIDGQPEQIALTAVAEALQGRKLLPNDVLKDGRYASETRVYLVHTTRFGGVDPFEPHLDALVVLQKDWAERVSLAFPYKNSWRDWARHLVQDIWSLIKLRLGPRPQSWLRVFRSIRSDRTWDIRNRPLARGTQVLIDPLNGAPLDSMTKTLSGLRTAILVDLVGRSYSERAFLLRGPTPEFHRPVRQALREALNTSERVGGLRETSGRF